MSRIGVELEGMDRLQALLDRAYSTGTRTELAAAMYQTANTVLNESKKIVPVDTGNLKASGEVSAPKVDHDGIEVEISYGGPAAPYAARQHWDLTLRHKPGQQALYLQKPVLEYQGKFVREVFTRYISAVRRG